MGSSTATEARVLGDFILGDKLGEGGFGTVYRAHQRTLDRPAVIKVMRRSLVGREDAVERFTREAKLASRFDHPYAAHVYAFGAEPDGLLWIAMELVRGTPLGDLIAQSGPLPIDRFVPLMERLCEVVHAGHEQGIVHRDIKPSNVMVIARSGRLIPKLLDFGIAKSILPDLPPPKVVIRSKRASAQPVPDHTPAELEHTAHAADSNAADSQAQTGRFGELTVEGQILGSPLYMAPEQWLDASNVGPWTDQYALAILAFEALTGRKAYSGTTISELAESHIHEPFPALPPELAPNIHAVLSRAAAKDPANRYPNLLELAAALRAVASAPIEIEEAVPRPTSLLATWSADAPRPIADAVAAVASARSSVRIADRAAAAGRTIARWLGALAVACASRDGKLAGHEGVDLVRELRRRALREDEWLEVAVAITKPFAAHPEAWPMPELVTFCGGAAAVALRALVRGDGPLVALGQTSKLEHQTAVARVAQLEAVLAGMSWMLDYEVAREVGGGLELWLGQGSEERVVRAGASEGDGRVVVLDADGARVVALSALVRVAPPADGEQEHMFLLAGPGRAPGSARYVAAPHGFEHEVDDAWRRLADDLLDGGPAEMTSYNDDRPPYPGLAAFTTDDTASFVGREREVEHVVNRLRTQPLIAVVGPSGVGKSSFLAAGIVPALPAGWAAAMFRPGDDPVGALVSLLDRGDATPYRGGLRERGPREPDALAAELIATATHRGETLVIVVDQAEELFTMCGDEAQRIAFAATLAAATRDPRIRVVIGMRDDFLCRVEELAPWRGTLARSVQILRVPAIADLERIVATPAHRRGYDFDDAKLPAEIAREVADRPGALPLLAFAATELWEQRDRHFKRLTRAAYDQIGGVRGALVQHADAVVDGLPAADRRLVRLAFRRLLSSDGTRAAIGRGELVTALGATPAATRVVERLLSARLIVSRDEEAGERVEIVHEALVTAWPRLAEWRREDDAALRIHEQLAAAARNWHDRDRAAGLLWRGDALAELRRWRTRGELALTATETAFVDASEQAARTTRRKRIGGVAAAFATLTAGVVVLGGLNHVVSRQRTEAERRLAASLFERGRLAVADEDAARGLLFLAEARRLGATGPASDLLVARATASLESERALVTHQHDGISAVRTDELTAIAFDGRLGGMAQAWDRASRARLGPAVPDVADGVPLGQRVAFVTEKGDVIVTDRDGAPRWRVTDAHHVADNALPLGIAGSTAGDVVVSFRDDAKLWHLSDGSPIGMLHHDGAAVAAAAFDASGQRVATADFAGGVRIWDAATARPLATCPSHAGRVRDITFSADGAVVASAGDDNAVLVCDAHTGAARYRFEGHANTVLDVDISHDGHTLVSASLDGTARLWNLTTGTQIATLPGHHGVVQTAWFSPDDRYVLTSGMDGTTRVWDATGGTALAVFRSTGSTVASAWQPGGRGVLSADLHGVMQEWDVTRALRGTASRQHAGAVRDLALSRDGKWSVTAGDGGVVLWDVTADVARTTLHVAGAINAQFSADGTRLVVVDADGGALWSVPDGTLVHRLAPAIRRAGFSPDGQTIVTGAADGTLQLWNASGGELAHLPIGFVPDDIVFDPAGRWAVPYAVYGDPHETDAPVIDLHTKAIVAHLRGTHTAPYTVAATATRLATNDGADVVLWDTATWQPVARMSGHTSDCTALAFLPDGRVVSAGDDHATYVWSSDGKLLATLPTGGARVWTIAPSHDGALFATGGRDGVVRVWDAASYGELMAMASHLGGSTYTAFTADDGWLLSAGTDGRVVRWDVRRPARSAAELASLVRCRVPYRFEGDDVLPREPDFDDPSCRN